FFVFFFFQGEDVNQLFRLFLWLGDVYKEQPNPRSSLRSVPSPAACPAIFRRAGRGVLIFPPGLNSEKTHGQPCIRSCPVAGSGLYLSAIHPIRTTLLDLTAVPGRIRFTA
ncbi:hypothetical protein P1P75_33615, partial [Streptomyces sp. ID05-39B]|uniref:hypothetical protein n=1 Tax=Streptomyces sp. ID05-39B TaxID=3028664 RepID=UPI0029A3E4C4